MKTFNILSLDIKDKHDKIHTLGFALMNTSVVSKYLDMLEQNRAIAKGNIDSNFNNGVESDYPELSNKLKTLVKSINEYDPVFNLPEYDTIQQKELNHLHELFEEWGATNDQSDRRLAKKFFMLNDLIHACEDTFTSGRAMGVVVDVKPSVESGKAGIHSTISNKDRFIVFDDVELFNKNSLNALLKIIEEPSKKNFFILVNNGIKPMLETITSRSLEFKIMKNSDLKLA